MRWYKPIKLAAEPLMPGPGPTTLGQINIVRNRFRDPSSGRIVSVSPQTRIEALENLGTLSPMRLGEEGIDAVIKAIDDGDVTVSAEAIRVATNVVNRIPAEVGAAFIESKANYLINKLITTLEMGEAPLRVMAAMAFGSLGTKAASVLPRLKQILDAMKMPDSEISEGASDLEDAIGKIEEGSMVSANDIPIISRNPAVADNLHANWGKYSTLAVAGADVLIQYVGHMGADSFFPGKIKQVGTETIGGESYPTFLIEAGGRTLTSRPIKSWDPNHKFEVWLVNEVKDVKESKTMWVRVNDPAVKEVSDAALGLGMAIGALVKIDGDVATVRINHRMFEVPVSSLTASRRVPSWGNQFLRRKSPLLPGNVVSYSKGPGLYVIEGFEEDDERGEPMPIKARIRPTDAKRGSGHFVVDPSELKYVGRRTLNGISTEPDVRSPILKKQKPMPAQKSPFSWDVQKKPPVQPQQPAKVQQPPPEM